MSLLSKIAKRDTPSAAGFLAQPGFDEVKPTPFVEMGTTGLLRTSGVGYVYDEWLRELSTNRWKQVYREMRDNDAVIGGMLFSLETILRRAAWTVEPADHSQQANQYAQFVRECMDDMSLTWPDCIAEWMSMIVYGFSLSEIVYKRRLGQNPGKQKGKPRPSSKFSDGLVGWRKLAPRAQESILYWKWDDEGGLQGAVQLAAPDWVSTMIPIESLLLFRTTSNKNNPEGRSSMRNCYRNWFFKRRLEEIEIIGIERDLCGMPVLSIDAELLQQIGGQTAAEKLVHDIRVDDQMGVVMPLAYDDKGNKRLTLELIKAAGSKQVDVSATIARLNSDILNTMLSGFIQLGQTASGSRALHFSASQVYALAISTYMDVVAATVNRYAIPRLMAMNPGMDLELAPRLVPGEVGVRDLGEIASFIEGLSRAGLIFTDPETQEYLRKIANLPIEVTTPKAPPQDQTKQKPTEEEETPEEKPKKKSPAAEKPGHPKAARPAATDEEASDLVESAV